MLHRRKSGCAMFASLPGIFQKHFVNPHVLSLPKALWLLEKDSAQTPKTFQANLLKTSFRQHLLSCTLYTFHDIALNGLPANAQPSNPLSDQKSPEPNTNCRSRWTSNHQIPFPHVPIFHGRIHQLSGFPLVFFVLISTKNPPKGEWKCRGERLPKWSCSGGKPKCLMGESQ